MSTQNNSERYPEKELTGKIIGCAFEVFKQLGYGLPEKTYQKALAESLNENNIKYSREKYGTIKFNDVTVGKYFLDFLVKNKVAVELKVRNDIYETDTIQLLNYLKSENIIVGLLIVITKKGARVKRLIN